MIELDKIYNEDCLEGMKRIADGAVDCIITDLPYGTLAGNNEFTQWDEVIPFEPLWAQFHRVMKSNGVSVLFGQEPFSTRLRMSNFKEYKYDIIWVKNQAANFANCRRQPMKYHENISVFYTKGATYNLPNLHKISPINSGRANKGGTSLRGFDNPKYQQTESGFNESVVYFANTSSADSFHPTQKPVDLLRYLILTYSNEGDTILDATIGSGTTAVAALMEKRHFIGFETNKEYFDIAQGRIDEVLRNPTLF